MAYENILDPLSDEYIGALHKKDYFSYKTTRISLNSQFAVETDNWICWIGSHSRPAGKWNDPKMINEVKQEVIDEIDHGDIVCFDGGYGSDVLGFTCCIPHRKPFHRELTTEEIEENNIISEFRGTIERCFGNIVTKYACIALPWRHGEEKFNTILKTVCSLVNIDKMILEDRGLENLVQNHPFFKSLQFDMITVPKKEEHPNPILHGNFFSTEEEKSEEEQLISHGILSEISPSLENSSNSVENPVKSVKKRRRSSKSRHKRRRKSVQIETIPKESTEKTKKPQIETILKESTHNPKKTQSRIFNEISNQPLDGKRTQKKVNYLQLHSGYGNK